MSDDGQPVVEVEIEAEPAPSQTQPQPQTTQAPEVDLFDSLLEIEESMRQQGMYKL
jgi:hypothetical protein